MLSWKSLPLGFEMQLLSMDLHNLKMFLALDLCTQVMLFLLGACRISLWCSRNRTTVGSLEVYLHMLC